MLEVLDRRRWMIEGRGQAAAHLGLNPSTRRHRMRTVIIKRPPRWTAVATRCFKTIAPR